MPGHPRNPQSGEKIEWNYSDAVLRRHDRGFCNPVQPAVLGEGCFQFLPRHCHGAIVFVAAHGAVGVLVGQMEARPYACIFPVPLGQRYFFRGQREEFLYAGSCCFPRLRIREIGDHALRINVIDQLAAVPLAFDKCDKLSSRL